MHSGKQEWKKMSHIPLRLIGILAISALFGLTSCDGPLGPDDSPHLASTVDGACERVAAPTDLGQSDFGHVFAFFNATCSSVIVIWSSNDGLTDGGFIAFPQVWTMSLSGLRHCVSTDGGASRHGCFNIPRSDELASQIRIHIYSGPVSPRTPKFRIRCSSSLGCSAAGGVRA